jgi:type I restriction enzyme, S subunit
MKDNIFVLSKIGKIFNGIQKKKANDFGYGEKFITYKQVFDNPVITKDGFGLVNIDEENEKQNKVKYGDVIITTSSETPNELATSSVFLEKNINPYLNSFCFGFRLNAFDKILPEFLGYLFRSQLYRKKIYPLSQGSTRYNISKKSFLKLDFPLKSISDQKKIILYLNQIDQYIETIVQKTEKIRKIKNSLEDKFLENYLNKNKEKVKLKDICRVRQGLQINASERYTKKGIDKYLYLTVSLINSDFDEAKKEYIKNPKENVILKKKDILVSRTGSVGNIYSDIECVFHNNFFAVSFDEAVILKNYFVYFLKSKKIQSEIQKRSGMTTIPDLNHGDFYDIDIYLHSLSEQKKISDILQKLDANINQNELLLKKTRFLKVSLLNELLLEKIND